MREYYTKKFWDLEIDDTYFKIYIESEEGQHQIKRIRESLFRQMFNKRYRYTSFIISESLIECLALQRYFMYEDVVSKVVIHESGQVQLDIDWRE